jgi:hypothetical protein
MFVDPNPEFDRVIVLNIITDHILNYREAHHQASKAAMELLRQANILLQANSNTLVRQAVSRTSTTSES